MASPRSPRPLIDAPTALALLDDLFAQRTAGLAVIDRELRYVAVSEGLAEMNGRPAGEHLGRLISEILPPDAAAALEQLTTAVFDGATVDDEEFEAQDGSGRRFRMSVLPVHDEQGVISTLLAVLVEVTETRRAERALRMTEERLRLALEGTRTGTFEYDTGGGAIHWSPTMGELWGRERGWTPVDLEAFMETVHPDDREPLTAVMAGAVAERRGYDKEYRIRWPDGEERWILTRVHVIGDADSDAAPTLIGLASDITARQERERALEYVAQASLAFAQSLDPAATLQHVADLAVPELADWCSVHLVSDDAGLAQVAIAHADPGKVRWARELQVRYPPDPDAPTGVPEVVRTGRSELYPEIPEDLLEATAQDDEHRRILRELALHSAMVVPLVARSRTIGAITFVFAESRREYTTEQLALAEDLGRRAGLAVDNARLHDAERRANERLRELQAVTDLGLAHLGLDDLLRELLRRIRDVTGSDTAAVLLHDADTGALRTRAALGEPSAPAGATLEVPLREGGQVLGVLRVSAREERPFDRDDVELLDLVADRAARAITHARLYEQANDVAVTLQRSLLSHTVPPIAGLEIAVRYQPGEAGTQVGGDWYDAFPLDGDCWGLVVGDVVGRGLTAAATMGQLRASLRAYAHEHPAPADAIDRLDQLALVLDEVPFATLAMLSVSPVDGEGHICVAGHPLPVLRDATGHASLLDVPIGPPLALRGDGRRAYPIALDPGATLLLYTDGLVERRDQPLDDRLAELEQAMADGPEDVEGLADHVLERMLGGSPSGDDAAIVVVRRPAQP